MAIAIKNKNDFITEAAKVAMHALLSSSTNKIRDPIVIAEAAREYAVELWRVMRVEA